MKTNVVTLFPEPEKAVETRFEEVWKLWPNRAKKHLAKAKYVSILKGLKTRTLDKDSGMYVEIELQATEDEIIDGVKAYLDSLIDRNTFRMKDDGKYVPHLATFLNQGRFDDYR